MTKKNQLFSAVAALTVLSFASAAHAKTGAPMPVGSGLTIDPIFDLRTSLEHVDQPTTDADALTIRLRSGFEIASDTGFSLLVEGEGTLGVINDYNSTTNGKTGRSVVADPQNVELNRLQLRYAKKEFGSVTVGRQRINIDDQRFVGSVGWRQNEQTFDAVSATVTALKPLTLEGTYSISQRTIFGADAGPRIANDGDFIFLGASLDAGPIKLKGFSYLLDYDDAEPIALTSTATYGGRASAKLPLAKGFTLDIVGTYAVQKDYKANPNDFSVDYIAGSVGTTFAGFGLTAGYENLGADGAGSRFQTPFATLHKFNGWADLFLSTPATGLEDKFVSVSKSVKLLGGIKAVAVYHDFSSDVGSAKYGTEVDAELSFKISMFDAAIKYANYNADTFGVDTEKVWLRLGYSF